MKCFITKRECRYDGPNYETKEIFMVSPFGFPYDDLYSYAIVPNVKEKIKGYKISRADQSLQLGYVMCERICRRILRSSFIIVDLTLPNGNVYYELGLSYGLCKSIGILKKKSAENPYVKALLALSDSAIIHEYNKLENLLESDFISKSISDPYIQSSKTRDAFKIELQKIIIDAPPVILNIVNNDGPVLDLHEIAIKKALIVNKNNTNDTDGNTDDLESFEALERWTVDTLVVNQEINIKEACKKIIAAKICVFDMTHYHDPVNAYMFFLLGLAHALEREAIPVINRPMNLSVPFDIRGLWQVNFDKIKDLTKELRQIVAIIDADVKKEQINRIYKDLWDPFLQEKKLSVYTCAREVSHDENRGKRTNIDKWDFITVSDLSFFIAQMYETAEVNVEKPKNKKKASELTDIKVLNDFHRQIRDEIFNRDCVIVGSPDVSDYAEVILSDLHGIDPHSQSQKRDNLPFVFFKRTQGTDHPRKISSFYLEPDSTQKDKVEFGKKRTTVACIEFEDDEDGIKCNHGNTCIVITLAKNPHQSENQKPRQVMILSGFTGVGTYGAIKFLTDPANHFNKELMKFFKQYNVIKLHPFKKNILGVHILLAVEYDCLEDGSSGDTRELKTISFKGIEPIFEKTRTTT